MKITISKTVKCVLTVIACILVLTLVVGLSVALYARRDKDITSFNVDVTAYKALRADDVKDCKTLSYIKGDEEDEVELFKLLLVSYDEHTKECVFIMGTLPEDTDESGKIEDDEAGFLCFVKAFDVEKNEVKQLGNYQSFKRLSLEKEYVVAVNFMGQMQGRWANVSTLFFSLVGDTSGADLPLIDAPTAQLKFKAEGTFKPSEKVMKALIGEV